MRVIPCNFDNFVYNFILFTTKNESSILAFIVQYIIMSISTNFNRLCISLTICILLINIITTNINKSFEGLNKMFEYPDT